MNKIGLALFLMGGKAELVFQTSYPKNFNGMQITFDTAVKTGLLAPFTGNMAFLPAKAQALLANGTRQNQNIHPYQHHQLQKVKVQFCYY